MTEKEKLIELLDEVHRKPLGKEYRERLGTIADHLIANGLSFSTPVVHCRDCKYYKPQSGSVRWNHKTPYCMRKTVMKVIPDDFCSFGEREVK